MKKYFVYLFFQFILTGILAQQQGSPEIIVDLNKKTEKISPLIYGQFIEFLGRCIDGGIYEEGSPLSDEKGFRKDVLGKIRELNTPLLRFPGGTVVKIYHWKDGIGEKNTRPKRKNLIWGGVMDNHFGTAEFVQYCREINAEPFLVVNMATDSPMDASDWVEYCNGTGDTYWANLRRVHGYKEPFNIKYWGIGNEEYAIPDAGKHQDANKYSEDAWQFVKLMKLQDPSIKITLVGNPEDLAWSRKVLSQMAPVCDYLSVHFYLIPPDQSYGSLIKGIDIFGSQLDSMRQIISAIPGEVTNFPPWYRFPPRTGPVKIAVDEWGIWDLNSKKGTGAYNMEYPYNWGQALATARFLNLFQRNADIIGLATWAQTVNVLAPIMTSENDSYCQTVYTPLKAYRQYNLCNNLPVKTSSPVRDGTGQIDCTASISDDKNEIVITVLNLSEKDPVHTSINFIDRESKRKIRLTETVSYTAPSTDSVNSPDKTIVMETKTSRITDSKDGFRITLAPASINFLTFKRN
jgi:alpha-N-arabinofuranosidase